MANETPRTKAFDSTVRLLRDPYGFIPDQMRQHSSDLVEACLDRFQPDVVIALSGETLNNFIALSENSGHNCHDSLLLVPVDRIAQTAREAGFNRVVCASGMADGEIVDQVIRCYSHHQADARSHPERPERQ